MSYLNPLHPPVPGNIRSSYTALANACSTHQPPFTQTLPPSHRCLPQTLSSKMTTSRRSSPCPAITFDLFGAPSRGLGIPMCELLTRSGGALERMVVGASDAVGAQMSGSLGFRRVNLKIMVMSSLHEPIPLSNLRPCCSGRDTSISTGLTPLTYTLQLVRSPVGNSPFMSRMHSRASWMFVPSLFPVVFSLTVFNRSCKVTPLLSMALAGASITAELAIIASFFQHFGTSAMTYGWQRSLSIFVRKCRGLDPLLVTAFQRSHS
jgi:hypothetical protein